jgi:hypothetical protein
MPVEQVFSLLDGYSAPANNTDEIFYTGSLLGSKYNVCTATISGRSVVTKTLVGGQLTIDYTYIEATLPSDFVVVSADTRVVDASGLTALEGKSVSYQFPQGVTQSNLLFVLQLDTPCGGVIMKGSANVVSTSTGQRPHPLEVVATESIKPLAKLTSVIESLEARIANLEQKYANTQ